MLRFCLQYEYKIIIVTNQYLIGEGIISKKDYERFNELFLNELNRENIEILDIFYCPHARSENCDCCKPKPGLIQKALKRYPDIDLNSSFMVGDSLCDLELAKHFNLNYYGFNMECENKISSLKDIIKFLY